MAKRKFKSEFGLDCDLGFDTETIKAKVNAALDEGSEERKIFMKRKIFKTVLIAAAVTLIFSATVFAVTPAGREAINSIIAYFASDSAREITDVDELMKHNTEIGKRCTRDGYTLTLDNVAADDNFVHVFYTLKSDKPFYKGEMPQNGAVVGSDLYNELWVECMIDGNIAGCINNNTNDSYFADPYTYKAVYKYNGSVLDLPEEFTVELFADRYDDDNPIMYYLFEEKRGLTEEEKSNMWYVSSTVNMEDVRVESITHKIDVYLPWINATVEKAVFSPFGNQLAVKTDGRYIFDARTAVLDENDSFLDLLNTDLVLKENDTSNNSFELLKCDKGTKKLKFVPINYHKSGDSNVIEAPVGNYPITYKVSDYGSVVVTDIRISDGLVEIDYYKDGFVLYDPGFELTNEKGENAEPGGKLGCVLYTDVHRQSNSYTARYVYDALDEVGNHVPMGEGEREAAIREKFTVLGVSGQRYFDLDFDKAVTAALGA